MLNKYRAVRASKRAMAQADVDAVQAASAHAFFSAPIAVMRPVEPQQAVNDDPLADVAVAVERELRVAGYLR